MFKSEVREFLGHFQTGNKKKDRVSVNKVIWKLPQSKDGISDRVSSTVWGVLTGVPKNKESLHRGHKTLAARFATTNFILSDLMSISKTPVHTRNIIKKLFEEMDDPILFEHFLVDFLSRNTDTNGMNYVLKGNRTLDNVLATDFTFSLNDSDGKPIKVGTQLTTCDYERRGFKKDKMTKLRDKLENGQADGLMNGMSARISPNLLALISVNGKIRESLYKGGTPFKEAYTMWGDDKYPTGGPTVFLDEEVKNVFILINHFLPLMTKLSFVQLGENPHFLQESTIVFLDKKYVLKSYHKKDEDIFSVLLFENTEGGEEFIFSTDFTQSRYVGVK